jgi:hypothetical protein
VQVDAGLTWPVSQGEDGVVVTLSDGTTLTLDGLSVRNLPGDWIFSS